MRSVFIFFILFWGNTHASDEINSQELQKLFDESVVLINNSQNIPQQVLEACDRVGIKFTQSIIDKLNDLLTCQTRLNRASTLGRLNAKLGINPETLPKVNLPDSTQQSFELPQVNSNSCTCTGDNLFCNVPDGGNCNSFAGSTLDGQDGGQDVLSLASKVMIDPRSNGGKAVLGNSSFCQSCFDSLIEPRRKRKFNRDFPGRVNDIQEKIIQNRLAASFKKLRLARDKTREIQDVAIKNFSAFMNYKSEDEYKQDPQSKYNISCRDESDMMDYITCSDDPMLKSRLRAMAKSLNVSSSETDDSALLNNILEAKEPGKKLLCEEEGLRGKIKYLKFLADKGFQQKFKDTFKKGLQGNGQLAKLKKECDEGGGFDKTPLELLTNNLPKNEREQGKKTLALAMELNPIAGMALGSSGAFCDYVFNISYFGSDEGVSYNVAIDFNKAYDDAKNSNSLIDGMNSGYYLKNKLDWNIDAITDSMVDMSYLSERQNIVGKSFKTRDSNIIIDSYEALAYGYEEEYCYPLYKDIAKTLCEKTPEYVTPSEVQRIEDEYSRNGSGLNLLNAKAICTVSTNMKANEPKNIPEIRDEFNKQLANSPEASLISDYQNNDSAFCDKQRKKFASFAEDAVAVATGDTDAETLQRQRKLERYEEVERPRDQDSNYSAGDVNSALGGNSVTGVRQEDLRITRNSNEGIMTGDDQASPVALDVPRVEQQSSEQSFTMQDLATVRNDYPSYLDQVVSGNSVGSSIPASAIQQTLAQSPQVVNDVTQLSRSIANTSDREAEARIRSELLESIKQGQVTSELQESIQSSGDSETIKKLQEQVANLTEQVQEQTVKREKTEAQNRLSQANNRIRELEETISRAGNQNAGDRGITQADIQNFLNQQSQRSFIGRGNGLNQSGESGLTDFSGSAYQQARNRALEQKNESNRVIAGAATGISLTATAGGSSNVVNVKYQNQDIPITRENLVISSTGTLTAIQIGANQVPFEELDPETKQTIEKLLKEEIVAQAQVELEVVKELQEQAQRDSQLYSNMLSTFGEQ